MSEEKLVQWDRAFDLGIDEIDKDHRALVDLVNNLNDLIKGNAPSTQIHELLMQAHGEMNTHFDKENDYIRKHVTDKEEADKHIYFHQVTLDYLEDVAKQYKEDPKAVTPSDLMHYLHGWIVDHIINQDNMMREHFERAGVVESEVSNVGFFERILDRFSLTSRIAALAVVPLITLLFFAGNAVLDKRATVVEMEKIEKLSNMAGAFSNLVHELQKERGASAGFLASKGKSFGDKVVAQRKNTDAKRKPIPDALGLGENLGLKDEIAQIRKYLNQLPDMRKKVTAQELTVAQEVAYYSALNASLLNSIAAMSKISNDLSMSNRISAFVNFLQSKERAGIERAKGSAGFGSGKFSPALLKDFIGLISIQDTYMKVARSFATSEMLGFMDKTISGEHVKAVDGMRNTAITSPTTNDLKGITGPQWFDTITKKINLLKQVENEMASVLVTSAGTIRSSAQAAFITLVTTTLLISAFIIFFAYILIKTAVGPLIQLRRSIDRLKDGHTETQVSGRHKHDEIGEMARAIQSFKEAIIRQNMERAKQGIEQSVRERTSIRRLEVTEQFRDDVASSIEKLSGAASELEVSANSMSAATDTSKAQSATVAAAATQATANVETVAAAAEELSSSIQEISRQVEHSSEIASSATTTAQQAQQTIEGLADGANKIGQVVSMITDIAEQTNLLALNATIEAARAGDAGKGFAVVASEVKNLANQTAKATEDITAQINTIQGDTDRAVDAISGVSQTIGEMNDVTESVSQAVDQQGSATQEISTNVNEAATGTRDVSNNIEGVAQAAEETGTMSGEVFNSAKSVAESANELRTKIDNFLNDVSGA